MKDLNMNCIQVNNAITRLVDEFGKKYYDGDFKMSRVERQDEELHYNFDMNQDYWSIDEVYTALWYDIPKKILFKYYDERLDKALKHEVMPNLKNFYLMNSKNKDGEGKEI